MPPRKDRTALIVLAVVLAGLLAVCAVGGAAFYWTSARPAKTADTPLLTREQFRAKVVGKTPAQVEEMLGVPHRTESDGKTLHSYTYKSQTFDAVTGKPDGTVVIRFKGGAAESLLFF